MNKRIKIYLKVNNPNYFIRELIEKKINLYNISKKERELELIIDEEDLEVISKIKTIKKLKIKNYYGLSKIKYLINKNKLIIILMLIGILINIFLSNIIFKVEVSTPNKELIKVIEKDLKKLGLKKYRLKISFNEKEIIKEKLKEMEKDKIEWLEIEEHGTKYIVKVEEKKLEEEEEFCNERNIIAKKNAVITKITSASGEIKKKINDYVEKGEVLISGLIYNKEEAVSKKCAIGEVYGEAWYKVIVNIPKNYKDTTITNNKSWGLSIKTLKKEINIGSKFQNYQKKEYNIIESKIIPLGVSITNYIEIKEKVYNNTIDNIDDLAYKYAIEKIEKDFENKPVIIRKKILKKQEENSKIKVEVFLAIEEDITSYEDITNIDIEEINKKESD